MNSLKIVNSGEVRKLLMFRMTVMTFAHVTITYGKFSCDCYDFVHVIKEFCDDLQKVSA